MTSTVLEFGPNDWYVQEKYEEFLADPDSVDPIWREHFGRTGSDSASRTAENVS